MVRNKRGWLRIVEAFVAVLIILGVILILLNQESIFSQDISEKVYDAEYLILREIQLNDALREDIMELPDADLPIEWSIFETNGLEEVKNKVNEKTPNYLECEGRICLMNNPCVIDNLKGEDIYAKSIAITTSQTNQSFRQVKLFCWVK